MQAYNKKQINNTIAIVAKECANFLCVKWNFKTALSLLRKNTLFSLIAFPKITAQRLWYPKRYLHQTENNGHLISLITKPRGDNSLKKVGGVSKQII